MITVVGSVNMDLVVEAVKRPVQGETLLGNSFSTFPGGKGSNQAVAAARLGGNVNFVGSVGLDSFGEDLQNHLLKEGICIDYLDIDNAQSTGVATIILAEGDNSIIVVPGANFSLSPSHIQKVNEVLPKSSMVIVQLEILPETVERVLELCQKHKVPVLLNPAPAASCTKEMIEMATYITPNETECIEIFGGYSDEILKTYPNKLIVTLGAAGAAYYDGTEVVQVSGYKTSVVDTTGAGDTFNGALGFAISEGYALREAVQFANAAASLSVEKLGAQQGMPSFDDVRNRLANRN
ncbi:ribokinase [Neobacillus niacini]|uniref:ribokinase n=1 Tax=Neobacillus niacini TaxID=86668 RepID=UPI00052F9C48|nr:ribokinase [Neobacillus niacini]KGM46152.1 ribokinase [Neobacillus niacini]MEC1522239.1 ribokinase [Neobacillus niacini]